MMKLANGLWCEDAREICMGVVGFFQSLFSSSSLGGQRDYVSGHFKAITGEERSNLVRYVTDDELCCRIGFLSHRWVSGCEPLAVHSIATRSPQACPVADFVDSTGQWDFEKLRAVLPEFYIRRISALVAPAARFGSDVVASSSSTGFHFHVVLRGNLLTNSERLRLHLMSDDRCSICRSAPEDVLHVLRECPKTWAVWERLVPSANLAEFMSLSTTDWVMRNLKSGVQLMSNSLHWDMVFSVMCWKLWQRRNLVLFDSKYVKKEDIVVEVFRIVGSLVETATMRVGSEIGGPRKCAGEL
ncbi:hypothetical protein V6N12_031186 [Hibiscus sabdariffa]|uniref:Reverse transcriptase zinc-binding domain-containing protein n=1 Tax=Hibiscus sabdariffa TaxID=183260 RepID=A0ABR2E877_9ROSI